MGQYEYILHMKDISKSFPGVAALNRVSLQVKAGEVHALMGENGAGKSTLMKILAGIEKPDSGEIWLKGEKVNFAQPLDALQKGISMIHQELNSIPDMTIAENLFVGREPCRKFGVVNTKEMKANTKALFQSIGMDIDPGRKLHTLTVAEMQMVEILKAVSYNADIIIMDEPTSAITDREVEKLFEIIRSLTKQGKAIIYISHKMNEIFRVCDTITVMRDGAYITTKPAAELDQQQLISYMVGRDLSNMYVKEAVEQGEKVLEVRGLSSPNKFEKISFSVRRGEILGIAGLMGAGRSELVETIFGANPASEGEIWVRGEKATIKSPIDAIAKGIALVTEDRKLTGLNLMFSVKNNITLAGLNRFTRFGQLLKFQEERKAADRQMQALNVKATNRNTIVGTLSGGNQQKVVLAKWLLCDPDILILDEPTRGIDIGAKAEIYRIINGLAKEGKAIVMISSEMPELLGMSDRIIVLHEGRMTGEFSKEEFHQERIMACAAGLAKTPLVSGSPGGGTER